MSSTTQNLIHVSGAPAGASSTANSSLSFGLNYITGHCRLIGQCAESGGARDIPDQAYAVMVSNVAKFTGGSPQHCLQSRMQIVWDADAQCTRFLAFLDQVFDGDRGKAEKSGSSANGWATC